VIRRLVVKVGTSSLTTEAGYLRRELVAALAAQVAEVRRAGVDVVWVASGAIALGLARLGLRRPQEPDVLQAASAVGQVELAAGLVGALEASGVSAGQILLTSDALADRRSYLHARATLRALFRLGVVPVVNENDAIASDEIRFGDNDRLAALVAHLIGAERLLLLTDTEGVYLRDPRTDPQAQLVAELTEEVAAGLELGGAGTERGSGGMSSKVQAAEIAARSGADCLIAQASRPEVILDAARGHPLVATRLRRRRRREPARRLWIAYAATPQGRLVVDAGAVRALVRGGASLLAVGIRRVEGEFLAGSVVEIVDEAGALVAKGVSRVDSRDVAGAREEVVHRDDLAVLRDREADRALS
jgi:glutamate 5-kinase